MYWLVPVLLVAALIIDQKGQIYRTYMGYRDKAEFEEAIRALLQESAAVRQLTGDIPWHG